MSYATLEEMLRAWHGKVYESGFDSHDSVTARRWLEEFRPQQNQHPVLVQFYELVAAGRENSAKRMYHELERIAGRQNLR